VHSRRLRGSRLNPLSCRSRFSKAPALVNWSIRTIVAFGRLVLQPIEEESGLCEVQSDEHL
jgi:hypothetical protein